MKCVSSCPLSTFANIATHTCDSCNTNCSVCESSANNCMECKTGWGWMTDFTCNNPCPTGYILLGLNCTQCDLKCISCAVSISNCSSCTLSGTNTAFLLVNTCLTSCPAKGYNQTAPNLCFLCDTKCLTCYGTLVS